MNIQDNKKIQNKVSNLGDNETNLGELVVENQFLRDTISTLRRFTDQRELYNNHKKQIFLDN